MSLIMRKINLIGEQVTLRIGKSARYNTFFSICLSILAILATIAFAIYFITNAFDTTSPSINIEYKTTSSYPKLDLHGNGTYLAFLPIKSGTFDFLDYVSLVGLIIKKEFVRDELGNIIDVRLNNFPMITKKCSEVQGVEYEYVKESNVTETVFKTLAYCLVPENPQDYYVQGQSIEEITSDIVINISPCSLPDPSLCKDPRTIVNILAIIPSPNLELSKLHNFLKYVPSGDLQMSLNINLKSIVSISFKKETVKNEREIFQQAGLPGPQDFISMENKRTFTGYRDPSQTYCSPDIVFNDRVCHPYVSITIASSGTQVITSRKYKELIFALSEIGGINEIIFVFAGVIYFIYQQFGSFDAFLVEKILKRKKLSKKQREEQNPQCEYEDYKDVVDDCFDIVKLSKELNGLKILNKVLFKDHHRALMPELLVKLRKENNENKEFSGCKKLF